jgi:hypothetical protein
LPTAARHTLAVGALAACAVAAGQVVISVAGTPAGDYDRAVALVDCVAGTPCAIFTNGYGRVVGYYAAAGMKVYDRLPADDDDPAAVITDPIHTVPQDGGPAAVARWAQRAAALG